MGTFGWPLRISGLDERETRELKAIVGTGAAHTTLPARLLRELGVEPSGRRRFLLADGRRTDMDYGQAWVAINGERVVTIVVFGEDEAPPLLGAYTLEGLALAVDPVEQRLVPTHMNPALGGRRPAPRWPAGPRPKYRPLRRQLRGSGARPALSRKPTRIASRDRWRGGTELLDGLAIRLGM